MSTTPNSQISDSDGDSDSSLKSWTFVSNEDDLENSGVEDIKKISDNLGGDLPVSTENADLNQENTQSEQQV